MSSKQHDNDIVCLAKAFNTVQAHIWEQALRDQGIECRVVGDMLDAGLGNIPGLRAELWVHRDDLEKAKQILERHPPEAIARGDDDDEDNART
jgi:hypothetical protein